MNLRTSIASASILLATVACADEAVEEEATNESLESITVIGTRTERDPAEVAATISVLDEEQIERELARNIADLIRYEPGVSVGGTGSRFGLTDFNIRGMGGNRVLTLVDGIRVPDEFTFGPFLSSRRDFVDIDSLAQVEIARGPISALWGSDALGGVVAFSTLEPQSYLHDDNSLFTSLKFAFTGADSGNINTVTVAGGGEQLAGLLRYTNRSASETSNLGSLETTGPLREKPDPQAIESNNVVAKATLNINDTGSVSVTIDQFESDIESQIMSDYGAVVFGTTVNTRDAMDNRKRQRVSANYRYAGDSLLASRINLGVFQQSSDAQQLTREARTTPSRQPQTRHRDSFFDQTVKSAFAQLTKIAGSDDFRHVVTFGGDYSHTASESLRDGGTFDASGVPQFEFQPLPTRDFPITEVTQYALYIQDEMTFADNRLTVTPSVRFDRFTAEAEADAIYLAGNRGAPEPQDYEASETSAKLAAMFVVHSNVALYGHFSQGFRAPPYDDVNVGFTNVLGGYKTISNPDLKSERSNGIEFGVRLHDGPDFVRLATFKNDYEDFIESFAIAPAFAPRGIDPADGFLTFQSVNRAEVTINGFEMSASAGLARVSEALASWTVRAALATATGEDVSEDQPLNSVDPLNGVLGLAYAPSNGRWGAEIIWTGAQGKDESDVAEGSERYVSGGYGTIDVLVQINPLDRLNMNIGLFNLTDKSYIRWIDTISIGSDAPLRFTQPGFNVAASARVDF